MDIQKLESFLALERYGSYTTAAEALYISQPALSKQIQSLEHELNVTLFDRKGRQTSPTIYGKFFSDYAMSIVKTYETAKTHIQQIQNLEEGYLTFGATNFIGDYLIPPVLVQFHERYPKLEINLTINSSKNVLQLLKRNALEFVLLSSYVPLEEEHYTIVPFLQDELSVIVGKKSPLWNYERISINQLRDVTMITKGVSSTLHRYIESQLSPHGFSFQKTICLTQQEAIKRAVIHNLGCSILSKKSVEIEVQAGLLRCIDLKETKLFRTIHIVYEHNKFLTPAALEFIRMLTELADHVC